MAMRRSVGAGLVLLALLARAAEGIVQLPLTMPGKPGTVGELMGPGQKTCYNLTLSDKVVKEVVWWEQAKLILRLEPCVGKPHLRVSVYGCPSDGGRVVWEYMSPKMRNDLAAQGKSLPKDWEWVGDVESLTIEVTHRTYYIEVVHQMEPYPAIDGQDTVAKFRLEAHLIDKARMPPEATNPLQHMCGWDRTLTVVARASYSPTVLAGYRTTLSDNDTKTEIEWFPPGKGGAAVAAGACPWHANISGDFEYQIYIHEITDYVGTSGVDYNLYKAAGKVQDWTYPAGDFVDVLRAPNCPAVDSSGGGECTRQTCRVCPLKFPKCPKEFLTNCTEVTANLYKLRDALNGTQRPLDSYIKRPDRYTMWTPCGLLKTAHRMSDKRLTEIRPPDRDGGWDSIRPEISPFGPDGKWWLERDLVVNATAGELQDGEWVDPDKVGKLRFRMREISESRNNVYLINVAVRDRVTGQVATYNTLTLQMNTAKYRPPELTGAAVGLIAGLSAVIVLLVAVFAITALFVKRKRMLKQAQKPQTKQ